MMKEYWVNVYNETIHPLAKTNQGEPCASRVMAKNVSVNVLKCVGIKTLYRIHVRLK